MPTPGLYTTADALPKSTLVARDLDRSWMEHGSCKGHTGHMQWAWLINGDRRYTDLPGPSGTVTVLTANLIKAALAICRNCPVQYDCVEWAVRVDETGGTWGLGREDMEWLKKRPEPLAFIAQARRRGQPVQVAVRRARSV